MTGLELDSRNVLEPISTTIVNEIPIATQVERVL
jgi:hypothetical protein